MSRTPSAACLAALVFVPVASASDHFVNPNRAGAFATLQQAHDAAAPGDRIVVEVSLPVASRTVITKSLTIESSDSTRKVLPYRGSGANDGTFLINALTPGLPLTLRNLAFQFERTATGNRAVVGIRTNGLIRGDLVFDQLSVDTGLTRPAISVSLVDVQLSNMWIHASRIVGRDTLAADGCSGIADRNGSDAVTVVARMLQVEDSEIVGGSAPFLRLSSCSGQSQSPLGGVGGAALRADTDATVIVRTFFSDGNGGDVQTGAWGVPQVPGRTTPSVLAPQGSLLQAYDSVLESGRDGRLGAVESRPRSTAGQISVTTAPFVVGGNGRLGGTVTFGMNNQPGQQAVAFMGFSWFFATVPTFGYLWVDPRAIVLTVLLTGNTPVGFNVPNDPRLVGLPIVGQAFDVSTNVLVNPAGIPLRQ